MTIFEDYVKTELPVRPVVQTDESEETILVRRGLIPRGYQAVVIAEGQVIGKSGGLIRGMNVTGVGSGGSDAHYLHTQSIVSTTWSVSHNLGKFPAVTVIDSGGTEVEGDIIHVDMYNTTLTFSAPFSGKAFFN